MAAEWERAEPPAELVDRIAPTPLLLVHGRDDHYFDEEQAWMLYRRAGEPKRLLLAGRFGHAEDGYTPSSLGRWPGRSTDARQGSVLEVASVAEAGS